MQKTQSVPQDVLDLADDLGIGRHIGDVLDLTQEMFPGPIRAEPGYDPEWPEDRYITLIVESGDDFQKIIQKELEWNRHVTPLIQPHFSAVTLSVTPR